MWSGVSMTSQRLAFRQCCKSLHKEFAIASSDAGLREAALPIVSSPHLFLLFRRLLTSCFTAGSPILVLIEGHL